LVNHLERFAQWIRLEIPVDIPEYGSSALAAGRDSTGGTPVIRKKNPTDLFGSRIQKFGVEFQEFIRLLIPVIKIPHHALSPGHSHLLA
jgi:hypothetical protein